MTDTKYVVLAGTLTEGEPRVHPSSGNTPPQGYGPSKSWAWKDFDFPLLDGSVGAHLTNMYAHGWVDQQGKTSFYADCNITARGFHSSSIQGTTPPGGIHSYIEFRGDDLVLLEKVDLPPFDVACGDVAIQHGGYDLPMSVQTFNHVRVLNWIFYKGESFIRC